MMLTKVQQDQWDAFVASFPFVRNTMRYDRRIITVGPSGVLPEDRSPAQVQASYLPTQEEAWTGFMQECRRIGYGRETGEGLLLRRPPTVERGEMGHRVTARFAIVPPDAGA